MQWFISFGAFALNGQPVFPNSAGGQTSFGNISEAVRNRGFYNSLVRLDSSDTFSNLNSFLNQFLANFLAGNNYINIIRDVDTDTMRVRVRERGEWNFISPPGINMRSLVNSTGRLAIDENNNLWGSIRYVHPYLLERDRTNMTMALHNESIFQNIPGVDFSGMNYDSPGWVFDPSFYRIIATNVAQAMQVTGGLIILETNGTLKVCGFGGGNIIHQQHEWGDLLHNQCVHRFSDETVNDWVYPITIRIPGIPMGSFKDMWETRSQIRLFSQRCGIVFTRERWSRRIITFATSDFETIATGVNNFRVSRTMNLMIYK